MAAPLEDGGDLRQAARPERTLALGGEKTEPAASGAPGAERPAIRGGHLPHALLVWRGGEQARKLLGL